MREGEREEERERKSESEREREREREGVKKEGYRKGKNETIAGYMVFSI